MYVVFLCVGFSPSSPLSVINASTTVSSLLQKRPSLHPDREKDKERDGEATHRDTHRDTHSDRDAQSHTEGKERDDSKEPILVGVDIAGSGVPFVCMCFAP